MTWEERLLFLMFLDYKGALKKWEKNHDKDKNGYAKIEDKDFISTHGFCWRKVDEGYDYWRGIIRDWNKLSEITLKVPSLNLRVIYPPLGDSLRVGCQKITKKDALKIADFIYECFGEDL